MVRRFRGRAVLAIGFAALSLLGCGEGERAAAGGGRAEEEEAVESRPIDPALAARLPAGATMESAEQGRALFATCATCHGFDGDGTQLGPSLRDTATIHGPLDLPRIDQLIRDGVAEPAEFPIPMPPQGGGRFDDAQIRALAAYVYLLGQGG